MFRAMNSFNSGSGRSPIKWSTTSPFLTKTTVGIDRIWKWAANSSNSSTSIFSKSTFSFSLITLVKIGALIGFWLFWLMFRLKLGSRANITIMVVCSRNMDSLKTANNFDAIVFNFLVRQNCLEFRQTSHIPRTDHYNRYFRSFHKNGSFRSKTIFLTFYTGHTTRHESR